MPDKKCFKCKKTKPIDQFYKHSQMADGYLNKCKGCTKKDVRRRYYEPEAREQRRVYEKTRSQSPERKKKVRTYQQNRRLRHPGKDRARDAVYNAVKKGLLVRQPCEECGDPKSEGHHTDYRRALDVKWLCFKHHRKAHGQMV